MFDPKKHSDAVVEFVAMLLEDMSELKYVLDNIDEGHKDDPVLGAIREGIDLRAKVIEWVTRGGKS